MTTPADLIDAASGADPREGLRAVLALRRLLERLEYLHVRRAREQGWSWQDIATVLGVSRQAVHQRYGDAVVSPPPPTLSTRKD